MDKEKDLSTLQTVETTDLDEIIKQACVNYHGEAAILESAIGALFIGRLYGWRVLRIVHMRTTYNRYQKVLGVDFKTVCPERGVLSYRSIGLKVADKLGQFWHVAAGKRKIEDRSLLS